MSEAIYFKTLSLANIFLHLNAEFPPLLKSNPSEYGNTFR
jgi:hypothetical protein